MKHPVCLNTVAKKTRPEKIVYKGGITSKYFVLQRMIKFIIRIDQLLDSSIKPIFFFLLLLLLDLHFL